MIKMRRSHYRLILIMLTSTWLVMTLWLLWCQWSNLAWRQTPQTGYMVVALTNWAAQVELQIYLLIHILPLTVIFKYCQVSSVCHRCITLSKYNQIKMCMLEITSDVRISFQMASWAMLALGNLYIKDIKVTIKNWDPSDPFYLHGLTLIPAWIWNHIHYKVWDKLLIYS